MSAALNEKRRLASLPVARWVDEQVELLPRRMAKAVRSVYASKARGEVRAANLWLLRLVKRVPVGVDLAASDSDIKNKAEQCAGYVQQMHLRGKDLVWLNAYCVSKGANMPLGDDTTAKWARASDASWWRRQLRGQLAQACESLAIDIGHVHRKHGLYCSNDAMRRRAAQKRRNRRLLESMQATNELGQVYTLQQLADLSVSNPEIRRPELMARIAGFELIARGLGHAAEFYTLTCPSQFHAFKKAGKYDVIPNPKYDPVNKPREAQQYLCKVWARIRAELHRKGLQVYGFRVVEPHHDGTPHWHMLLFMEQRHIERVRNIMRKHALKLDGDEPGAAERRFTVKAIDYSQGTAIGYIAKYISKNIDGMKADGDSIGDDHEAAPGTDASESAHRVEAWAANWRVRQFQQIGGAPVTIWRELRRWQAGEVDEAEKLGAALWREVRGLPPVSSVLDDAVAAADAGHWNTFIRLMGGPLVKRSQLPLSLMKVPHTETRNRYGEIRADVTKGVLEHETGAYIISRVHEWVLQRSGEAASTRSPVNNCTEEETGQRYEPKIPAEWLEWLDGINSGQPLNVPEEIREALDANFFTEWATEETDLQRAIREAGGADEFVRVHMDAATRQRTISRAVIRGRRALAGWTSQGIAGLNNEHTSKAGTGGQGTGIRHHDERPGTGESVRTAGRRHDQGAGGRSERGAGNGARTEGGHHPAAAAARHADDAIERARAWLRAT